MSDRFLLWLLRSTVHLLVLLLIEVALKAVSSFHY